MTLEELHKNGTLRFLYNKGLLSPSVFMYFDYKKTFTKYRVTNSYRQACELAAIDHKVSSNTIKRALLALKE